MKGDVIPFSKIHIVERCPECNNPFLKRFAEPQDDTIHLNGQALYAVFQACPNCKWIAGIENVKIGA
jgi:uncharacterized protein with PIN domain